MKFEDYSFFQNIWKNQMDKALLSDHFCRHVTKSTTARCSYQKLRKPLPKIVKCQ